MSDGRMFTSYVTSCQMNEEIKKKYGLDTNEKYRRFLMKNPNVVTNFKKPEAVLPNRPS